MAASFIDIKGYSDQWKQFTTNYWNIYFLIPQSNSEIFPLIQSTCHLIIK